MKWLFRYCGCGAKSIDDMSVDELCDKVNNLEEERQTKIEEIHDLEKEIKREMIEDLEKTNIVTEIDHIYREKREKLNRTQKEFDEIESSYKKKVEELDGIKKEYREISNKLEKSNHELEREIEETRQLKQNRKEVKSRIIGIDDESDKLRNVIDNQIVELSEKITKLEEL